MLRSLAVTTRRRRHIVAIVAILFIAVASTFAVIVLRSIETISTYWCVASNIIRRMAKTQSRHTSQVKVEFRNRSASFLICP
jgi:cytochrome c-type biogenesis protein CcmE